MPETYRTTTSAKEALQDCLAFNSRDWGAVKADAWIWGIVFGWDADDDDEGDPMAEVAARHGWDAFDVENLRTLHADFVRLAAQEPPPASGNATDAVMQVLADEGLLAAVPLQQELRLQQKITTALAAPKENPRA